MISPLSTSVCRNFLLEEQTIKDSLVDAKGDAPLITVERSTAPCGVVEINNSSN
jgi:hypothetical protein